MGYTYPIDPSWTMEELLVVMDLLNAVEKAYEKGLPLSEAAKVYRQFKQMGFSISDEKQLDKAFENVSGYSLHAFLVACKRGDQVISLKVGK